MRNNYDAIQLLIFNSQNRSKFPIAICKVVTLINRLFLIFGIISLLVSFYSLSTVIAH